MYSLASYGRMIADPVRMNAYEEALRRVVFPGAVVVDIGTGPGLIALIACRLGARRVYAIEPSDAIQIARELAEANGYSDRIECIQDVSTAVTLPERADVVVSDLRGILPLFQKHIPSIADARRRLLAPGGSMVPQRDTLWATIADAPDLYEDHAGPWTTHDRGFDLTAAKQVVANKWRKARIAREQVLVEPRRWATLDYRSVEDPDVSADLDWEVDRAGTGYGLSAWFDATLIDGVGFSCAPGEPEVIYGGAFFPWPEPVPFEPRDTIAVGIAAILRGDDYIWRWTTRVRDGASGRTKAEFAQSSFFGHPISPTRLRVRASTHVPEPNEEAEIDRLALEAMYRSLTLMGIAELLHERFPHRFPTVLRALDRAGTLSERYSR